MQQARGLGAGPSRGPRAGGAGGSSVSGVLRSPSHADRSRQFPWLQPAPLHTHFLTDLFTLPVCLLSSR